MKFVDFYKALGVSEDATQDDIKKAYRTLARKFHPDVNKAPGAEKRFTDVNSAYEELHDPVRRTAYDRLKTAGLVDGQEMDPASVHRGFHQGGPAADMDADVFDAYVRTMFDRHRGGRQDFHHRGEDAQYSITITLEEAFRGGDRQFTIDEHPHRGSSSTEARSRTITVKIPVGVVQGTGIRLRGQGHPGSQPDMAGDLILVVDLAPHAWYRVQGGDIHLDVPITPWEAALGGRVAVPTLGGRVTMTIPANAQNGQRLRLKGRGLPLNPPGDQYLTLMIVMPPVTSSEAMVFYRGLAQESNFDPRARFAG